MSLGAPITRELLAEVVGDPQHEVIDVEGEDEPDDQEALGRGSEA